jgi:hypothetical protein
MKKHEYVILHENLLSLLQKRQRNDTLSSNADNIVKKKVQTDLSRSTTNNDNVGPPSHTPKRHVDPLSPHLAQKQKVQEDLLTMLVGNQFSVLPQPTESIFASAAPADEAINPDVNHVANNGFCVDNELSVDVPREDEEQSDTTLPERYVIGLSFRDEDEDEEKTNPTKAAHRRAFNLKMYGSENPENFE